MILLNRRGFKQLGLFILWWAGISLFLLAVINVPSAVDWFRTLDAAKAARIQSKVDSGEIIQFSDGSRFTVLYDQRGCQWIQTGSGNNHVLIIGVDGKPICRK